MKTLPNGPIIFNATPHAITFWREGWDEPINVEPDELINASVEEKIVREFSTHCFVETRFVPDKTGHDVISRAREAGADVVVGSIIAAQAYPGRVVAMTPAPGYERVPPQEKRMNPDKFTVFS